MTPTSTVVTPLGHPTLICIILNITMPQPKTGIHGPLLLEEPLIRVSKMASGVLSTYSLTTDPL